MENKTCSEIFSERLTELRQQHNETSRDLARALDVSFSAISNYQLGKRTPDIVFLQKVAQHFNVTTDYLLGLSDVKSTEQDMKTVCELTGLSEEAIYSLYEMTKSGNRALYSSYILPFLNYIIEKYDISNLSERVFNIVMLKKEGILLEEYAQHSADERKITGRTMNAYEVGNVFALSNKNEEIDLAIFRLSKYMSSLIENIAEYELKHNAQEDTENAQHNPKEE